MSEIQRYGDSKRRADVVVHRGAAHWVEVAEDMSLDARGQIAQVLAQMLTAVENGGAWRSKMGFIRGVRGSAVPGLGAQGFMNRHVATPP